MLQSPVTSADLSTLAKDTQKMHNTGLPSFICNRLCYQIIYNLISSLLDSIFFLSREYLFVCKFHLNYDKSWNYFFIDVFSGTMAERVIHDYVIQ